MHFTRKVAVAALATMAFLAALAPSASAGRFEFSNQSIRTIFTPLIWRSVESSTISCTLTLEGSFHSRTLVKVANTLIGYITRAIINTPGCRSAGISANMRMESLAETLPWHIRYVNFSGTLPRVNPRVQLINASLNLLVVPLIGTCRYRLSPKLIITGPAGGDITEGNANIRAEETENFPSETAFCPESRFVARAPVTLLGTTTAINVRLI